MLTYNANRAVHAGRTGQGPLEVVRTLWRDRTLVGRLVWREIEARYRGSLFGLAWSFVTPVFMVAVYTFVFSVVFGMRWRSAAESQAASDSASFGIVLFAGLLVFQFFSECLNRAPGLMLENPTYIKKIVFPLDTLAWVALGGAFFNLGTGVLVLLAAHLLLVGVPPWTALLLPLVVAPLGLLTVGMVWAVSAVGVYLRDLRQIVGLATTMLMFLCPIFYPLDMVPEAYRPFIHLNPLTYPVTEARGLLLDGRLPDPAALGLYTLFSFAVAWLGLVFFRKVKRGFIDVL